MLRIKRSVIAFAILLPLFLGLAPSVARADGPCYFSQIIPSQTSTQVYFATTVKCTSRSNYLFEYRVCQDIPRALDVCTSWTTRGPYNIGPTGTGTAVQLTPTIGGCVASGSHRFFFQMHYESTSTGINHEMDEGDRYTTSRDCS